MKTKRIINEIRNDFALPDIIEDWEIVVMAEGSYSWQRVCLRLAIADLFDAVKKSISLVLVR